MRIATCSVLLASCTALSAFGQTELIINGGFETPSAGEWQISGTGDSQKSSVLIAYDGSAYLALGAFGNVSDQLAFQSVFIPTNTIAATLSYFYDIYSAAPQADNSTLFVEVYTNGVFAARVDQKTQSDTVGLSQSSANYVQKLFDLTSFKGRTNQIVFRTVMGTFGPGTFFDIDDVSVVVATTADLAPNDYFTNRTVLAGTNTAGAAKNTFATKEPGEPNHAGNVGGRSVWWSWTAPVDGVLQLNTVGSTFTALLAVYTGTSVSNLTRIASSDGSQASDFFARVKLPVRAGTEYEIAVDGVNSGAGAAFGMANLNLGFTPDTTKPTVTISSPAAGAKLTNSTVTVQGTAGDNVAVATVLYRLENGSGTNAYQTASGTNHWTATLTNLVPGLNLIRVFAFDTSSNFSTAITRTFNYVLVSAFRLSITGGGKVLPNYTNSLLEIGHTYVITATPASGQVFSNWTGDITSSNPKLSFVMQSNLTLQAHFIPNPFIPAKGTFAGLLYGTNGITTTNAGLFTATVTASGSFTAKIVVPAFSASFAGKLAVDGSFSNAIPRPGRTFIPFYGSVDLAGGNVLTATFGLDAQAAQLIANRAVYSKTNQAPEGGRKYTIAFPGSDDASNAPAGFGIGTATVDTSGNIIFSGTLGDGIKISQHTFVSRDGMWPFFASPYAGKGSIIGWLTYITNPPPITITGAVSWVKLPKPGKLYPLGFDFENNIQAQGSVYTFSNGVPLLSWTNGQVVLQGGNLTQSITNPFTISSNYKVAGSNKLSLTFTTASGSFKGTVLNTNTAKTVPINGVLLQSLDTGYGYFLGTNQSGSVLLLPQ